MHLQTSDQEKLHLGFGDITCNWGMHICGLYQTEEERDEILMGFLHQGNIDGDLQLYVPAERSRNNFCSCYAAAYPAHAEDVYDQDRFQLFDAKSLYYPEGVFSPRDMDKGLNAYYRDSQKNGKRNIRATAEMVWALEAIPGTEHLMIYESRLNYFIPDKPWISICLYNTTRFDGSAIMQVLQTHPYTISGGVITENPFYQDPDDWLAAYAPDFLTSAMTQT